MKWYNKLILVVTVCSVLLCSSSFVAFADSSVDGGVAAGFWKSIFNPDFVVFGNSEGITLSEYTGTVAVPASVVQQGGFSDTTNYDGSFGRTGYVHQSLIRIQEQKQGYGYIYRGAESLYQISGVTYSGTVNVLISFNDVYLHPTLAKSSEWRWLNNFYIGQFGLYPLTHSSLQCIIDFDYMTYINGTYKLNHVENSVVPLTDVDFSTGSANFWSSLQAHIKSIVPVNSLNYGILINALTLRFADVPIQEEGLEIKSFCKLQSTENTGAELALRNWSQYYGKTVYTNPSLLESMSNGINAIMESQIFGTFTLGQVFGACIGLALFTWFLKIFAGG